MQSQDNFFKALFFLLLTQLCSAGSFAVLGTQPGPWPSILSSVGHIAGPVAAADILVASSATPASVDWNHRLENGAALILEGSSPLAASFGFRAQTETASVVHVVDIHNPSLPIVWNRALEISRYEIP